jgi:FkbM family methyltransferase
MLSLKDIIINSNIPFNNVSNKIILPNNIKYIKIDVGLSFDAPHSQNWIDNDYNNDTIVFGFEANPRWVNYIISEIKDTNFKDYHNYTIPLKYENLYKKFFIVPVALSDVEIPIIMDFYVPEHSEGCCSLLQPNEQTIVGKLINIHKVPVFNLSNFLDYIDFDKILNVSYLKVDVQGCDINVLKGAKKYLSDKIVYVTAEPETNQYIGAEENSTENIINYMENQGFHFIKHPNTLDPTFLNKNFMYLKDTYIWQQY